MKSIELVDLENKLTSYSKTEDGKLALSVGLHCFIRNFFDEVVNFKHIGNVSYFVETKVKDGQKVKLYTWAAYKEYLCDVTVKYDANKKPTFIAKTSNINIANFDDVVEIYQDILDDMVNRNENELDQLEDQLQEKCGVDLKTAFDVYTLIYKSCKSNAIASRLQRRGLI